jgi:hypothetical protein
LLAAGGAYGQTPLIAPNRISPEQQATLDKFAELQKRKPADTKDCDAVKVKTPLKHPGNVLAEHQAAFAKCMTARGHYVP